MVSKDSQQPSYPADLSPAWLEAYLPRLTKDELAAYLLLANKPNAVQSLAIPEATLDKLERLGLVEILRTDDSVYAHLLCCDESATHHGRPCKPPIRKAVDAYKTMISELLRVTADDDGDQLRAQVFAAHPGFAREFEEARLPAEVNGKCLWLELSRHLMRQFERSYGRFRHANKELFREISVHLLQLQIESLERISNALLDQRQNLFEIAGEGWVATISQPDFTARQLVRDLVQHYQVGAQQLYLSVLERVLEQGWALVDLDDTGQARNILLPTTTGLGAQEQQLVFFTLAELEQENEAPDLAKRVYGARIAYRHHLLRHGILVLIDLLRGQRLTNAETLISILTDRLNGALDEVCGDDHPSVILAPLTVEQVQDAVDDSLSALATP